MHTNSFYDLDYIIAINEKRHEQYISAYQKISERHTNIILIYSALTIFLIPLIQDLFAEQKESILFKIGFGIFSFLFAISILFTVRLIIPVKLAHLQIPKKYYYDTKRLYERLTTDKNQIGQLLKSSYIKELETAVTITQRAFDRKNSFYYNALIYGLLSVVPYLLCLTLHISKKHDNLQEAEIVKFKKNSIFNTLNKNSYVQKINF